MSLLKLRVIWCLVAVTVCWCADFSSKTVFTQEISSRFLFASQAPSAGWKQLPVDDIVQSALGCGQSVWMLSRDGGLYTADTDAMSDMKRLDAVIDTAAGGSRICSVPADCARVVVATPTAVLSCSVESCDAITDSLSLGNITSVVAAASGQVFVGGDLGLAQLAPDYALLPDVKGPVTALAYSEELQQLAVGTPVKLHLYAPKTNEWEFEWIAEGSNIDSAVTSLAYTTVPILPPSPSRMTRMSSSKQTARTATSDLWIGNEYAVDILTPKHAFHRLSGLKVQPGSLIGGLPGCNITTLGLSSGDGSVWIASTQGLSRYSSAAKATNGQEWSFYSGPRWLPAGAIASVLHVPARADKPARAVVTTETGLAVIVLEQWTLQDKADLLQTMVSPRHDRYGLVATTSLAEFGDLSTYELHDNDNDGLWTSMYLASQCYRYSITKDPEVKKAAWKHFEALKFLNDVTCIPGLMARSVVKTGAPHATGLWTESECFPGWTWKADASADEVVGHAMIYPMVYDLLAETKEEKDAASSLILNTVNYIVDNDYYLIDFTGNHTLWGIWNPSWVNDAEKFYDQRGLNAVQMLAWLVAAYRLSPEEKFAEAYSTLWTKHGYGRNIINQKITFPGDYNFSDDELSFLSLYTFWYTWTQHKDRLAGLNIDISLWEESMERSCAIASPQKSALWNAICAVSGIEHLHEAAHSEWDLQQWPTELVDWPFNNSVRADVTTNPVEDRWGRFNTQIRSLLPADERGSQRWNSSPFEAAGGSGMSETDPGAFLLAYWINRFHGIME